jgi:ubiquitin carboxyl-terminal hydrolase 34
MADLMWSTVKEPLDTTLCFDKESLDLAFKYFMSPTLTMRLAGLSQITVSNASFVFGNSFVCLLNKCNNDTREGLYYSRFNAWIILYCLHK